jgi:hypothetical protein
MKAVIYHAPSKIAEKFAPLTYEKLIHGLRKNVNKFGMPLVHLTLYGQQGMGDENHYFDGDPEDVIWNREKCFIEFLKKAPDDVYFLTEPDSRIVAEFPELNSDLALLRRNDSVALNPAWRLVTKKAIPFFEEVFSYFPESPRYKQWDGDSIGYIKMWEQMGKPGIGKLTYNGMDIELRNYDLYCKKDSLYVRQWKSTNKAELLRIEHG